MTATDTAVAGKLSTLDRFLPVWIGAAMVAGLLLGRVVPGLGDTLAAVELDGISLPIALGLLIMMYPVLAKVRYDRLDSVTGDRRLLLGSLALNWIIGPALMFALAWLLLPDLPEYRTGLIIVGLARCIAMVIIWNDLACGDREAAAVLVALNSVFQVVMFAVLGWFYLSVLPGWLGLEQTTIDTSPWQIAKSVLIFLGIPLVAGFLTRRIGERTKGRDWYESSFLPRLGPWALYGLLFTIVILFALQGEQITSQPWDVVRIALPLLIYFAVMWGGGFVLGAAMGLGYARTTTLAFTAAGNNFELAIAVAIATYGATSGQALAGVIGPLIEVPVLVALVYVSLALRKRFTTPTTASSPDVSKLGLKWSPQQPVCWRLLVANNRVPAVKRERFWVALGEGSSVAAAARVAGVSAYSGYVWMAAAGQPLPSGRARRRRATLEDRELFWAELRAGASIAAAARAAGVSKDAGRYWITQAGGMRPATVNPTLESMVSAGRGALSWVDRCRIEDLVVAHYRPAQIARLLGRARSTIARELRRGVPAQGGRYRAQVAQDAVDTGRRRPKERRIAAGSALYAEVVRRLRLCHSPEQIAGCLRVDFPDDPEMWVSHETIYQALYVQARGGLKAEVKRGLRTGRIRRKPQGRSPRPGPIKDAVSISERPAEAEDRAVPGHWECDLIIGAHGASAIGTLVERTTGFVMLLHLPGDHTAQTVATAMSAAVPQIPEILRRSLTWDRGSEMALHTAITEATGLPIYFADPHSPWQRGSNENTNGLLRQYFPKGTDLSEHGPGILDNVAAELNARPRKRHGWLTPAAKLDELLRSDPSDPVAATG